MQKLLCWCDCFTYLTLFPKLSVLSHNWINRNSSQTKMTKHIFRQICLHEQFPCINIINNLMDSLGGDEKMQFHACFKVGHPPLSLLYHLYHFPVRPSASPSVCLSVHPSVCRTPYLRKRTPSNHNFWYTCVK